MFDRNQNRESCRLVILKPSICQHKAFECTHWGSLIDFVEIFDDFDLCFKHVESIRDESIFLIIENELYEKILPRTMKVRGVYRTYIFNAKKNSSEEAAAAEKAEHAASIDKQKNVSRSLFNEIRLTTTTLFHQSLKTIRASIRPDEKVARIYTNLENLITDLSNDLYISARNSTIVSEDIEEHVQSQEWSFEPSKKSSRGAFSKLVETLIKKKPNENSKQIFAEKCRLYYVGNPSTLNLIDEFEQTYSNENAIWWYTRNTFLYLLLNKSLRQQNIEMIIHLHFFVYDVHNQIAAHYKGTNPRTTIEKYYRGQIMTAAEIDVFKKHDVIYTPLTLNTFLSTTKDYQMALIFAGSGAHELDEPLQSVVFIIELLPSDFNSMEKEYADISQLSACPTEEETLFTVVSLLYFDGMEYDANEIIWLIKLTNWSTSDCFSYGRYWSGIEDQSPDSTETQFIHLGHLLSEKSLGFNIFDLYDEKHKNDPPVTEQSFNLVKKMYYDVLLQNSIFNQFVYNIGLGSLAFTSGQIDIAAEHLLKALSSEEQIDASDDKNLLILLYDTLGHIDRERCEYELALQYYSKSVTIHWTREKLNNLACIYKILGHYDHALTLTSYYRSVARARDKHRDSLSSLKEWKLFVDYTVANEKYLCEYHSEIIQEYLIIGKINACIPTEESSYNYSDYRLKQNELPVSVNDVHMSLRRLHVAIDCFQHVINLCQQFDSEKNSSSMTSANQYMTITYTKIVECRLFKDF